MRPCHFATKADGLRYVCTLDHAHTGSHRLAWEHSREATAGASEVAPNPLPTWLDRLPARDVTPPSTDEERAVSAEMMRDHRIAARVQELEAALADYHERLYPRASWYHELGSSPKSCLGCRLLACEWCSHGVPRSLVGGGESLGYAPRWWHTLTIENGQPADTPCTTQEPLR